MSPESKVTCKETAQRLKELGFPQETERWWARDDYGFSLVRNPELSDALDWIAAPDAQEIGEWLPKENADGIVYYESSQQDDGFAFRTYDLGAQIGENEGLTFIGKSEAETRAACLIWLVKHGLVKFKK